MEKQSFKAVYCQPAYLTHMLSTTCEMLGCMNHQLESRLLGDISVTSDVQMNTTLMGENEQELKGLFDECERGE